LLLAVRETNTAKLGAFIATSCEQQDRQMRWQKGAGVVHTAAATETHLNMKTSRHPQTHLASQHRNDLLWDP
jgi:hypothetical protein